MAKRNRGWTEDKIARYLKEGRGIGELSSYKPWLTVQNVSSKGNSPRNKGWKTERIHELFSNLERSYYYYLEWASNVVDIREQFPLDRQITIEVASLLNITHPVDKDTKTPIVLTTDFFITLIENKNIYYLARTIKPSEHLEDPRVIEKFEIEKVYWERKGINWGIVTELDFNKTFVSNIDYLHRAYYLENNDDILLCQKLLKFLVEKKFKSALAPLLYVFDEFEQIYNLDGGSGILYFKHLLARKQINVDMYQKINPRELVLKEIVINKKGEEKQNGYFIS